jgi:SAM-dependent methyltransferase
MAAKIFDDLVDVYESMIDWPKRLAHEAPFYRRLFERAGVQSVVDVACGTGRHGAMFHSWGLRVEGADISPGMIQRARATFGEPDGLQWTERSFQESIQAADPFDAAVCVGNSLALASHLRTAERAIGQMVSAVGDRGIVVVHVLNLWRIPEGPCIWQKCVRSKLAGRDLLILKGVHRHGARGYVELVVITRDGEQMQHESVEFLGLEADMLEQLSRKAGAANVHLFGGYENQPYDRQESVDLVLVAEKG